MALKAEKNQSWKGELKRKYKVAKSKRTVDKAVDDLLAKKMIIEVKDAKKLRSYKPNAARAIELTSYGLLVGLYYQRPSEVPLHLELKHKKNTKISKGPNDKLKTPTLWREIDLVAERHKERIPLIFGKWEYFKKQGWVDLIVNNLQDFFECNLDLPSMLFQQENLDVKPVLDYQGNLTFQTLNYEEKVQSLVSEVIKSLTSAVIFPKPTHSVDYASTSWGEISGWEKTLLSDAELRKFVFVEIANRERFCRNELKQFKLWRKLPGRLKN